MLMGIDLSLQNAAKIETEAVRSKARDLFSGADVVKAKGTTYLFQGINETDARYTLRLNRAAYENVADKIIKWRQGILFRKPHTREAAKGAAVDLENVDNAGTSADVFFADVARDAQIDGVCFVLVDAPIVPEGGFTTLKEQDEAGWRPFFQKVPASALLDWAFGDDGALLWAVVTQASPDRRTEPGTEFTSEAQYKVWTRTEWRLCDSKSTVLRSGQNPTGVVPIIPFYGDKHADMAGWSTLRPVLEHIVLLYNKQSDLDWFEMLAAHPVPTIIAPNKPEKLNMNNGLYVQSSSDGAAISVSYLEISGAGFDAIRQSIGDIRAQIYSIAIGQARKDSAQVEAAEGQREYKKMFAASLRNAATSYQNAEQTCWNTADLWMKQDNASVAVAYNTDFDDSLIDTALIELMGTLADSSRITVRTLLKTMQDGELLPSDFDIEKELKELESASGNDAAAIFNKLKAANGAPPKDDPPDGERDADNSRTA